MKTCPDPDTHPIEYALHVCEASWPDRIPPYRWLPRKLKELVPAVEDLDLLLLGVLTRGDGNLRMGAWHAWTPYVGPDSLRYAPLQALKELEAAQCGTTHCRAGWAIHLAGIRGYALEVATSPADAGRLIYEKTYPRRKVPDFHVNADQAMCSIRKGARSDLRKRAMSRAILAGDPDPGFLAVSRKYDKQENS